MKTCSINPNTSLFFVLFKYGKTFPISHGIFPYVHGIFPYFHGMFLYVHGIFPYFHRFFPYFHGIFPWFSYISVDFLMGFSQCSKVFSKDFWSQVPNGQAFVGLERGPGHFRSIALGFREPIEAQRRMSWDLSGCSIGFQWNFKWMFNFHGNFELFLGEKSLDFRGSDGMPWSFLQRLSGENIAKWCWNRLNSNKTVIHSCCNQGHVGVSSSTKTPEVAEAYPHVMHRMHIQHASVHYFILKLGPRNGGQPRYFWINSTVIIVTIIKY